VDKKLRWAVGLLALCYALQIFSAVFGAFLSSPGHVHGAHPEDAMTFAAYASTWAITLSLSLAMVELLIALVPLRRCERWAFWAQVVPIVVVGIPRIAYDPRCLANIMSQHGCHSYMVSLVLAIIGLGLAAPAVFGHKAPTQ
jgi:hypothetical protein